MEPLHAALRTTHIAAGLVGLAAFWVPVAARKGSRLHVVAGRLFSWSVYAVVASALASASWAIVDPASFTGLPADASAEVVARVSARVRPFLGFLGMLAVIVLASARLGQAALELRHDIGAVARRELTVLYGLVGLSGLVVAALGAAAGSAGFAALGVLGGLNVWEYWRIRRDPLPTPMAWWYHHMGAMLGTGIAFHTAVAVTTAGRLLGIPPDSPAAIIPWVLPAAIGVPAIQIWTASYRRRFREAGRPARGAAVATSR